ncbi:MAG TPA: hypothetical protein PK509_04795 [Catalimonadaceae bacterium]|nr:hypothetical protein [Catalimonadaceae bacterium]
MATEKSVFIFPYSKPFTEIQNGTIRAELSQFLHSWNSHGTDLSSEFRIEENQFIVVSVDESSITVGGCSKDKLFKTISNVNSLLGLTPGNVGKFYVRSEGKVIELSRNELRNKLDEGRILPDNELFPTWITGGQEFDRLWAKPLFHFAPILRLENLKTNFSS